MDDSGAARVIAARIVDWLGASRAVLAVVLACAVLTYGGVSLFVVAFAVYPIAVELFRAVDVPKRLIPATIALGAFTFTMTALPGTPAIQNAIPMPYFGTTPFAAPGLGLIGGVVMLLLGMAVAFAPCRPGSELPVKAMAPDTAARPATCRCDLPSEGYDVAQATTAGVAAPLALPSFGVALAPIWPWWR